MRTPQRYFIRYVGFGHAPPASPSPSLFAVPIRNHPFALNTLDDEARKAIARAEGVDHHRVTLVFASAGGKDHSSNVIENLLRKHRPLFQSEAEAEEQGAGIAWFEYSKPFELDDF